jgi:hypothetical protein
MKKSKIFVTVLLLAMFSSLFTVIDVDQPVINTITPSTKNHVDEITQFTTSKQYLGTNETYINNMTSGFSISIDGSISDWVGAKGETFGDITLWYGFDATHLMVAAQWADSSFDDDVNLWNKTGMDENGSVWEFLPGADDMFAFGIISKMANMTDLWIWTASDNRTDSSFAYETNSTFYADSGTLPHIENEILDVDGCGYLPLYENNGVTTPDYVNDQNGTKYWGWIPSTPSHSQTDVEVAYDWNNNKVGFYTIEMSRALDTLQADDIIFDPANLTDHRICFGRVDKDDCADMEVALISYNIYNHNTPASLHFSAINSPVEGGSLIISGNVTDDYNGLVLTVELSGWSDTYGPGSYDTINYINPVDGTWIYYFSYNKYDMPLGENTVTVTLHPKYEDQLAETQDVIIEDNTAPEILGVSDVAASYPHGLPIDSPYIIDGKYEITCVTEDVYWDAEDLLVELYYFKDFGITQKVVMIQFYDSNFFDVYMNIEYESGTPNVYTYYVNVTDGAMNKSVSGYYSFLVITPTVPTPGFGVLIAIFGLAGASFILYRRIKK